MHLELVGRVAPVELSLSPRLVAPIAAFLHSSKVGPGGEASLVLPSPEATA